jgi:[ribosomal protein S5]-alanine N-acetyltransferase
MKIYSQRLCLKPLEQNHAELLFDGLQSARIYDFIEDVPPQRVVSLCDRYMVLARRQSLDERRFKSRLDMFKQQLL